MREPTGPATREMLEELHCLCFETLIERLKRPRVGIEQVAVARAFVRDNQAALVVTPAMQRRLQKLYTLTAKAILKGLETAPSASMINQAITFLSQQGVSKDYLAHADKATTARTLGTLAGQDLPFTKH